MHAPLCGKFCPNSVAVARYDTLVRTKSPTNCDAHLAKSIFQTRSSSLSMPHVNSSFCHLLQPHTFTPAHSLCHTSTALFAIFFNLTPPL
ncbi:MULTISPECIES: DUF6783 domain-containing protein [Blautia]|uniref:DUF6783 domain-containing protein n=1 Tax=Blautia TaxID=572511 RepID=UPI002FE55A5B